MKYFGTDGIRGVVGETLTADFAKLVGFAYGNALTQWQKMGEFGCKRTSKRVLVGRDTRSSGQELSLKIGEGIRLAGYDAVYAGVITTPTHNYSTKSGDFVGGVMITASHNPASHNGIKLCDFAGKKYSPEFLETVENFIKTYLNSELTAQNLGQEQTDFDIGAKWVNFLLDWLDFPDFSGVRVALDLANGAGYELIPQAFEMTNAEVVAFNTESDGKNINNNCGSLFVENFAQKVVECGADIGFSFDGDADRILAVDRTGRIVDGTDLMYIFGNYYAEQNKLPNMIVVSTPITNMGLEISLKNRGITLKRTSKVGGQYVQALMEAEGYAVGGEENGHILLRDIGEGSDGLFVGLYLLKIMRDKGCDLCDLLADLHRKKTAQSNLYVTENQRQKVANGCLDEYLANLHFCLNKDERVIVRPSGTECLVRVLVEGDNASRLNEICAEIESCIKNIK